jgi:hypothetical protein
MRSRAYLVVFCAALAVGATGACSTHSSAEIQPPGSAVNVITRDELDSAGAVSIYDVIVRRHAYFLRDRGATSINSTSAPRAVVFMGEQYYGEIETMRNIPAERVASARFYAGTEAAAKFGRQYNGGVIQLLPRFQ